MGKPIKVRRGLNIPLKGEAEKQIIDVSPGKFYALKPTDFHGVRPKIVAKPGVEVKVGTTIFYDKFQPEVQFCSPVSGVVKEIVRGEKRKLLAIIIESDDKQTQEMHEIHDYQSAESVNLIKSLLQTGFWPMITQRPYGVIADPNTKPDFVFVSTFDSAPLAPDYAFVLENMQEELKVGMEILHKISGKEIHLGLNAKADNTLFENLPHTIVNSFEGPHPAGNVGTQINAVRPINKGEIYWTVNIQNIAMIGRLFLKKTIDFSRMVSFVGSELNQTGYLNVLLGQSVKEIIEGKLSHDNVRVVSGNPLTGKGVEKEGYLSYQENQITVLPEGDYYEFFGWLMPGFKKFSLSRTYFSWLMPGKKYRLDTNYHGGERAYVVTGEYEKVCPLDIYPQQLVKACMTEDIDKMEQLGIYEVIEEDMALCEFVCTSKTEVQSILRESLDMLRKEMS